jgi:hypothetical protein
MDAQCRAAAVRAVAHLMANAAIRGARDAASEAAPDVRALRLKLLLGME